MRPTIERARSWSEERTRLHGQEIPSCAEYNRRGTSAIDSAILQRDFSLNRKAGVMDEKFTASSQEIMFLYCSRDGIMERDESQIQ